MDHDIRIENWEIIYTQTDPYKAPEQCPKRLRGRIYGHPKNKDGVTVKTSQIMKTSGNRVKTCNSWYVLGKPHPKYVKWCEEHAPGTNFKKPFSEK